LWRLVTNTKNRCKFTDWLFFRTVEIVSVGTERHVTPGSVRDYTQWLQVVAAMLRDGFTREKAGKTIPLAMSFGVPMRPSGWFQDCAPESPGPDRHIGIDRARMRLMLFGAQDSGMPITPLLKKSRRRRSLDFMRRTECPESSKSLS
jgi:hypothetical protein